MYIDALSVLCAQLTRDLLAIAKFLFKAVKESWCPSRSTVALLFGSDQACARIRSSCMCGITRLINPKRTRLKQYIAKKAIRIIFSCACDMPYTSALFVAGLEDLDNRRDLLSHNFFSNLFYYRHLVYIVYFRHLAILNYGTVSP